MLLFFPYYGKMRESLSKKNPSLKFQRRPAHRRRRERRWRGGGHVRRRGRRRERRGRRHAHERRMRVTQRLGEDGGGGRRGRVDLVLG